MIRKKNRCSAWFFEKSFTFVFWVVQTFKKWSHKSQSKTFARRTSSRYVYVETINDGPFDRQSKESKSWHTSSSEARPLSPPIGVINLSDHSIISDTTWFYNGGKFNQNSGLSHVQRPTYIHAEVEKSGKSKNYGVRPMVYGSSKSKIVECKPFFCAWALVC